MTKKDDMDAAIGRALAHHHKAGVVRTYLRLPVTRGRKDLWLIGLFDQDTTELTTGETLMVCKALAAAEKYSARTKELIG